MPFFQGGRPILPINKKEMIKKNMLEQAESSSEDDEWRKSTENRYLLLLFVIDFRKCFFKFIVSRRCHCENRVVFLQNTGYFLFLLGDSCINFLVFLDFIFSKAVFIPYSYFLLSLRLIRILQFSVSVLLFWFSSFTTSNNGGWRWLPGWERKSKKLKTHQFLDQKNKQLGKSRYCLKNQIVFQKIKKFQKRSI